MRIGKKIKCKKCSTKVEKQDAYRYWNNVDCFENIISTNDLIDITWIRNWWLCNNCYTSAYVSETRFHDIDGAQFFLSWKFPFVRT